MVFPYLLHLFMLILFVYSFFGFVVSLFICILVRCMPVFLCLFVLTWVHLCKNVRKVVVFLFLRYLLSLGYSDLMFRFDLLPLVTDYPRLSIFIQIVFLHVCVCFFMCLFVLCSIVRLFVISLFSPFDCVSVCWFEPWFIYYFSVSFLYES